MLCAERTAFWPTILVSSFFLNSGLMVFGRLKPVGSILSSGFWLGTCWSVKSQRVALYRSLLLS